MHYNNCANKYRSFVSSFADAADEVKKKKRRKKKAMCLTTTPDFNHQIWLQVNDVIIKAQGSHDNFCKND